MDKTIETIYRGILDGDQHLVPQQVTEALNSGHSPDLILKEGLVAAMSEVGRLFENGEYFVPEMLVAARAMQAGLKVLKPALVDTGVKAIGRIVIGTVAGDLHDIGKNLVAMMVEGAGWEVIDLGIDVNPAKFIETIGMHPDCFVGLSAMLTTTMENMEMTVREIRNLYPDKKILVGGAPLTDDFCRKIGASFYSPDPQGAVSYLKGQVA